MFGLVTSCILKYDLSICCVKWLNTKRENYRSGRSFLVYYVPLVPDLSDNRVVAQMVDEKDWGIFCQPDCEMIELHIQANPNCRIFNIPTVLFNPTNVELNFRAIYKVVRVR